nr:tetratricopeptide repeat protein [uncultured Undibacterium sp.]
MLAGDFENQKTRDMPSQDGLEQAFFGLLKLAQDQFNAGQYEYAIDYLKPILQANPQHPDSNHLLVKVLIALRDYETALPYIEICLQMSPKNVLYWDTYVELLHFFGDSEVLSQALALKTEILQQNVTTVPSETSDSGKELYLPDLSAELQRLIKTKNTSKKHSKKVEDAAFCQLVALCEAKKYQELERYSKQLITENICAGFAWRFLGVMFLDLKQLAQAKQVMAESIRLLPNDATSHFNYALACAELNERDTAERYYRKAIQLDRNFTAAYNNLGNLLRSNRKFDEAESILRKLVKLSPNSAVSRFNLVNVLVQKDDMLVALDEAIIAENLFPQSADICNALGSIYFLLERHEEAIPYLEKAIALDPEYADAVNNLGSLYFEMKRFAQAKPYLESAVRLAPKLGSAYRCLGQISRDFDHDLSAGIDYTRKALKCDPNDHVAHASLLFMLSELDDFPAYDLFLEHQLCGKRLESRWADSSPKHANIQNKNKTLRVGFVSGDFYHHAVASFIAPILKALCTKHDLILYAYYNNDKDDLVTKQLREYFQFWKNINRESDDVVYQQIQDDQIDILFDLSGHTLKNRLPVFARKPAPLAITWIGYPGTTGMKTIDYYFTDQYFLPAGAFDQFFTEKHIRLPASAAFVQLDETPDVNTLPALSNGFVTFGSFNRLTKISPEVMRVWCNLLKRVPTSRLLLGAMPSEGGFENIISNFAAQGIARDRLIFFGRCRLELYLEQLNRVDICLDTFPYNGGTTTMHSLWMGVPVITISGETVASRTGTSALSHVGLARMASKSKEGFVEEGVYWANHLEELAAVRKNLRARLQASPLMNGRLIADHVASSLRKIWERWCDDEAPVSFDSEL